MKIKVSIDGPAAARLRSGSAEAQAAMMTGLERIGEEFVSTVQASVRAGKYSRSFSWRRDGQAVVAGSSSPLAAIIEKGRKPGRRPPTSEYMSFPAATRIAERGTKGKFVVSKAAIKLRRGGTIERIARQVIIDISKG